MSGVIDDNGTQWEHCNVCRGWVRIQDLLYEAKSEQFPYGLDLCADCAAKRGGVAEKPKALLQIRFEDGKARAGMVLTEDL